MEEFAERVYLNKKTSLFYVAKKYLANRENRP
jgi:hypothetical protein